MSRELYSVWGRMPRAYELVTDVRRSQGGSIVRVVARGPAADEFPPPPRSTSQSA